MEMRKLSSNPDQRKIQMALWLFGFLFFLLQGLDMRCWSTPYLYNKVKK